MKAWITKHALTCRIDVADGQNIEDMRKQLAQKTAPIQRALESACLTVTGRSYEEVNTELEDTVVEDPEES